MNVNMFNLESPDSCCKTNMDRGMSRVDLLLKEANVMAHQYSFFLRLTSQTLLILLLNLTTINNHTKIQYMIFKQNCTDCLHLKNLILV